MPAERVAGYDHPHFPYRAIVDRPRASFKGLEATVAVIPLLLLEYVEDPLPDWPQLRSLGGGLDRASPNISRISTREYGHRVGIFRMVQSLTERGLAPTVAVDSRTAEEYPVLLEWLRDQGTSFVAHGESATRPITELMSEEEERAYVGNTLARLYQCGVDTDGWLGPEYGESSRTPAILAQAGVRYVFDWSGDEQPVRFTGAAAGLTGIPTLADLDDQTSLVNRMLDPTAYGQHLADAVRQLARDGATSARVVAFCVRPWLTGQPFRIGLFEAFLDICQDTPGAWVTPPPAALGAYYEAQV